MTQMDKTKCAGLTADHKAEIVRTFYDMADVLMAEPPPPPQAVAEMRCQIEALAGRMEDPAALVYVGQMWQALDYLMPQGDPVAGSPTMTDVWRVD